MPPTWHDLNTRLSHVMLSFGKNVLVIRYATKYRIMLELSWITILVASEVICLWFSRVTMIYEWQSSANLITNDQKSLFTVTHALFHFLHAILCPQHPILLGTIDRRQLISLLSLGTVFSDLPFWRHHSWSVTSRERVVQALLRNFADCSYTRKLTKRRISL